MAPLGATLILLPVLRTHVALTINEVAGPIYFRQRLATH